MIYFIDGLLVGFWFAVFMNDLAKENYKSCVFDFLLFLIAILLTLHDFHV